MIGIYTSDDELQTRRVLSVFQAKGAEFLYSQGEYQVVLPDSVHMPEEGFYRQAEAIACSDLKPPPLISFRQISRLIGYRIEVTTSKKGLNGYVSGAIELDNHVRYLVEEHHIQPSDIKIIPEVA